MAQVLFPDPLREAFLVGIHVSASSYCSRDEVVGRLISVELGINLLPSAVNSKAD